MALTTTVIVRATCDVDGTVWELPNEGKDYRPFSFMLNNSRVEGEVCPLCQARLEEFLEPFASKLRPVGGLAKRPAAETPATRVVGYHDPREKESKLFPCLIPTCPNGYSSKRALNEHRRRDHGERFEFGCRSEGCREEFETERGRTRHETGMHPGLVLTEVA